MPSWCIELGRPRRAADRVAQARRLGREQRHLAARLTEAGRALVASLVDDDPDDWAADLAVPD